MLFSLAFIAFLQTVSTATIKQHPGGMPHSSHETQASQRNREVELAIKKLHEHQSTNIEHQGKPQQLLIQGNFHVSNQDPEGIQR